jgi:hypothetical protein
VQRGYCKYHSAATELCSSLTVLNNREMKFEYSKCLAFGTLKFPNQMQVQVTDIKIRDISSENFTERKIQQFFLAF